MAVGHGLFLRLFAEYANALEVLGAWGWALRNRRDYKLFLDAYLAYPNNAPREFFRAVRRNRSGSLCLLLKLTREDRVVPAMAEGFGHWSSEECTRAMEECFGSLRRAAGHYFSADEIIRTAYNRSKHGATMLRVPDLGSREFYVVAPHLSPGGKRDRARYDLSKFTVNKKMIQSLEHGVGAAGLTIRFLAGLTRALSMADLL
jgi:hypothetical protein